MKRLELNKEFEEGNKPEILVEDTTEEYLKDPHSLFNLTLSNFPKA